MVQKQNKTPQDLTAEMLREYIHSSNQSVKTAALQRLFMENTEAIEPLLKVEDAGIGFGEEKDFDPKDFLAFCEIIINTELFEDQFISKQIDLAETAIGNSQCPDSIFIWMIDAGKDLGKNHVIKAIDILNKNINQNYERFIKKLFFAAPSHSAYMSLIYDTLQEVGAKENYVDHVLNFNVHDSEYCFKIIELLVDNFDFQAINEYLGMKLAPFFGMQAKELLEKRFLKLLSKCENNPDWFGTTEKTLIKNILPNLRWKTAVSGYKIMMKSQHPSNFISSFWSYIMNNSKDYPTQEMDYLAGFIDPQNAGVIIDAISATFSAINSVEDDEQKRILFEKNINWLSNQKKWFNELDIENTTSIADHFNNALETILVDLSELKNKLHDLKKCFYQSQNHGDKCAALIVNDLSQDFLIEDFCKDWFYSDLKFRSDFEKELQKYWKKETFDRRFIIRAAKYAEKFLGIEPILFKASEDEETEVSVALNLLYSF